MEKQYTKDELWKLFEQLPEELRDAVFSEENARHLFSLAERYGIEDVSQISYYVGLVFLGILPPEQFRDILAKELKRNDPATTAAIYREIDRLVFYPVRPSLDQMYHTTSSVIDTSHSRQDSIKAKHVEEKEVASSAEAEQQPASQVGDPYREVL